MVSFFTRLLWPARCLACGAPADEIEGFCPPCAASVVPIDEACRSCALPLEPPQLTCTRCRYRPFPFAQARAVLVYGGATADAIVRFKHGTQLAPARPLGRYFAPLLEWAEDHGVVLVVPVPLHPHRLRSRGFNQTLELVRAARALARGRRLPPCAPDLLVRTRDTPALGTLPPLGRRHQVAGAFAVRAPSAIAGARVMIVDDVMTTGATLAECAHTLLTAGAARIFVGALARAL
jgi:ComF family protein